MKNKQFFVIMTALFFGVQMYAQTVGKGNGSISLNRQKQTDERLLSLESQHGLAISGITPKEIVGNLETTDSVAKELARQIMLERNKVNLTLIKRKFPSAPIDTTLNALSLYVSTQQFLYGPTSVNFTVSTKVTSLGWEGNRWTGFKAVDQPAGTYPMFIYKFPNNGDFVHFPAFKADCSNNPGPTWLFGLVNGTASIVDPAQAGPSNGQPGPKDGPSANSGVSLSAEQLKLIEAALKNANLSGGGNTIIINAPYANATGGAGGTATNGNNTLTGGGTTGTGKGVQTTPAPKQPANNASDWGLAQQNNNNYGQGNNSNHGYSCNSCQQTNCGGNCRQSQSIACTTCPGGNTTNNNAWNRSDVAYVEGQLAQNNKYAKRTADATTATAVGSFVGPILGAGVNYLLNRYLPINLNQQNYYVNNDGGGNDGGTSWGGGAWDTWTNTNGNTGGSSGGTAWGE